MTDTSYPTVAVSELRVGLYVHLDLAWIDHPFASSSFKIGTQQQIDTIHSLGLQRLRYSPERSDPPASAATAVHEAVSRAAPSQADAAAAPTPVPEALPASAATPSATQWAQTQRLAQLQCERQYAESSRAVKALFEQVQAAPQQAGQASAALVQSMVSQLTQNAESALRLLADGACDRSSQHAINVAVLSVLLGQAMGHGAEDLQALALAALWHDVGKLELPQRVRLRDDTFGPSHLKLYQEHVMHSVVWGKRLGLPAPALLGIAQHHELADGSGFPRGLAADKIAPISHILALVNRYDGLCNPANPIKALTPHEALAQIFASLKARFEARTLSAFIRMMGIYPPGSVVQLSDGRYALVMSVNAARPLKPRLRVYDAQPGADEPAWLDLQQEPHLNIQRSLRPDQLPRPALNQLSPRPRVCYYFERAVDLHPPDGAGA